jgi:hypothetical protein
MALGPEGTLCMRPQISLGKGRQKPNGSRHLHQAYCRLRTASMKAGTTTCQSPTTP